MRPDEAQGHKGVTVNTTACRFDYHLSKWNIQYFNFFALVSRQSAILSSAKQLEMPLEFGGIQYSGMEYSVNLNKYNRKHTYKKMNVAGFEPAPLGNRPSALTLRSHRIRSHRATSKFLYACYNLFMLLASL